MSITKKPKGLVTAALGAVLAVVAAPTMLFLGAGTAHAGGLDVSWNPHPSGLDVHVRNLTGVPGQCTYDSRATFVPLVPAYHHEFYLPPWGTADWTIASFRSGILWDTTVNCSNGGSLFHRGQW